MINTYESTREYFVKGLMDIAKDDDRCVFVSADTLKAARATPFMDKYPNRVFDVGIAEQNALGFASGLATSGLMPFVSTYAGFITMRACEQMRTFIAYPNLNVKLVGLNGGVFGGEKEGVTHQFYEDIAITRSIPNMTVVVPCDAKSAYAATKAISKIDGPAYLRIGSGREYPIKENNQTFELGKINRIYQTGSDLALFTNGPVTIRVIEAAKALNEMGIHTTVVDVHTIKPLDVKGITKVLKETNKAITIEDHNIIGGLGSAICEVASENHPVPIIRKGLNDCFAFSGGADELLDHFEMSVNDIVKNARAFIGK